MILNADLQPPHTDRASTEECGCVVLLLHVAMFVKLCCSTYLTSKPADVWHQVWLIRNIFSDKNPVKALCLDLNTVQAPVLNMPTDAEGVSPCRKD